jgi:branched-chain amino acid transport system substrate-binding protein
MFNKDPINVGVLYSETGLTATIGRSQLQGASLAIDEINEGGGIDGRKIVPIHYDAQSSPTLHEKAAIFVDNYRCSAYSIYD